MLGACLLLANREKEAAGLLMSLPASSVPSLGLMAGEAWLRAGQPAAAIAPLEQTASARKSDGRSARILALAYALSGEAEKGLPALTTYLNGAGAKDGPALAAGVYAAYRRHLSTPNAATLAADRTQILKLTIGAPAAMLHQLQAMDAERRAALDLLRGD